MSCEIVLRGFLAIGTKHSCPSDQNPTEIPKAIEDFKKRINEIPHRTGKGLIMHEPQESDKVPTWYVVAEVSELANTIPESMFVLNIPEQRYVTYTHNGSAVNFGNTYSLLHTWILNNGHYDHGYVVERQSDSFNILSNDYSADVYVPFKPQENS
ncbi:hypothetical protein FE782_14005 [Paenibacillus antri]|uniref:AraC effector-binding domain-containing protein n=1 Tax=Paenibacillus antri TaxID=2582848 RepID=A0A5R9GEH6_9BACL|nr:effector binding domain-containing protein [Paenibacillus antri]TLS51614.1 hypothetical protein FE782_14005 [Paenibacillus antri]